MHNKNSEMRMPTHFKLYYTTRRIEEQIKRITDDFLAMVGLQERAGLVFYCIRELIANAQKANTKRLYFEARKLDILDPEHYRLGMQEFKEEIGSRGKEYFARLEEKDLYVYLAFWLSRFGLHVRTVNPLELLATERERIEKQNELAITMSSAKNSYLANSDEEEGGGLGIIITIGALAQLNNGGTHHEIFSTNGITVAEIGVAMTDAQRKLLDSIQAACIDCCPVPILPDSERLLLEHALEIQPHFAHITQTIPIGVALLLHQLAGTRKNLPAELGPFCTMVDAIDRESLQTLFQSARGIQISRAERTRYRTHCKESFHQALYTLPLSRMIGFDKSERRLAYFGALMKDTARLLFAIDAHRDAIRNYDACVGVPSSLIESVLDGLYHDEIGAALAEHWHFPQTLVDIIRYHKSSQEAPEHIRPVIDVVRLAHFLYYSETMDISWELLPSGIPERFSITSNKRLAELHDQLQREVKQQEKSGIGVQIE